MLARVKRWRCPNCERLFGRPNQSHECIPALTLEQYLERQPEAQRPIYRAVLAALKKLDVDIDPVNVGIMIKRARTFLELRPKKNAVSLSFKLSGEIAHPRFVRVIKSSTQRRAYFVDLRSVEDVDAEVRAWIRASYQDSPP